MARGDLDKICECNSNYESCVDYREPGETYFQPYDSVIRTESSRLGCDGAQVGSTPKVTYSLLLVVALVVSTVSSL